MVASPVSLREAARAIPQRFMFAPGSHRRADRGTGLLVPEATEAFLSRFGRDLQVSDEATTTAIRHEFASLAPLALRALVVELHLAREGNLLSGESPQARFESFIAAINGSAWQDYFFSKYPVLSSLYGRVARDTVAQLAAVKACLSEGAERVRATFGFDSNSIDEVVLIGDRHDAAGRSARVRDRSGRTIFVKPRSGHAEAFVQEVIDLIGPDLRHKPVVPVTMAIGSFCVQEAIEAAAAENVDNVAYLHGTWAAMALAFNARDLHFENIIVSDRGPVVVDFECFFSPLTGQAPAFEVLHGLLRSGLLPMRVPSLDRKRSVDWSAMGGAPDVLPNRLHLLADDGTDSARLSFENLPLTAKRPSALQRALRDGGAQHLVEGFGDALSALASNMAEVTALVDRIDGDHQVRVVLKPTQHYSDVGRRAAHPRFLLSHDAHSEAVRTELRDSGSEQLPGLLSSESLAVGKAGAPLLSISLDARDVLTADGGSVFRYEATPRFGVSRSLSHIAEPAFRRRAMRLMRQVLIGRLGRLGSFDAPVAEAAARAIGLDELLRAEVELLVANAVQTHQGAGWLDLIESGFGDYEVEASGHDLYSGLAGTYLALADAGRAEGAELRDELFERLEATTLDWMQQSQRYGAFSGGAGVAYALASGTAITKRTPPLMTIGAIVDLAVEGSCSAEQWDLLSGSAGVLLLVARLAQGGYLPPEDATRYSESLLQHLENCVDRSREGLGQLWWPRGVPSSTQLGGAAHGVAGVALALRQVAQMPRARTLLAGSLSAQRSLRTEEGSWADRREVASAARIFSGLSWCHGVGGISMLSDSSAERREARAALSNFPLGPGFDSSLCHGLSGAIVTGMRLKSRSVGRQVAALTSRRAELLENDLYIDGLIDGMFLGRAGVIFALSAAARGGLGAVDPLSLSLPGKT